MNIHEYQAKQVLAGFGVPVPKGKPAFTVEEAVKALTAAIEPMMTLFLGGTVMFIVAALYFPLMGIMSGPKR